MRYTFDCAQAVVHRVSSMPNTRDLNRKCFIINYSLVLLTTAKIGFFMQRRVINSNGILIHFVVFCSHFAEWDKILGNKHVNIAYERLLFE